MPKKTRIGRIIKQVEDTDISPEEHNLLQNRRYRFKELVGESVEEHRIEFLVQSDVDYWDLDNLLKKGCDPDTAIAILL